jgi:hypothetical protein
MQHRLAQPSRSMHATPAMPTRPAPLQATPHAALPTRVLQSARVPQQLCLQFHR